MNPTANEFINLDNEITRSNLKQGAAIRKRTLVLRYQVRQSGLAIEAAKTSVSRWNKEVYAGLKEIPSKLQDVIATEHTSKETTPDSYKRNKAVWTDFFKILNTNSYNIDDSITPISKQLASLRKTARELSITVTKEVLEIKKAHQKFDATKMSIFKFASLEKALEDLHAEEKLLESLEHSIAPAQAIIEVAKKAIKSTLTEIAQFEKLDRKVDKQPIAVFIGEVESQIAAVLEKIEELTSLGGFE